MRRRLPSPGPQRTRPKDQSVNCWRYRVAASKASSTFFGLVPLPMLVGALPPALPPTMLETAVAQSLAERPFFADSCADGERYTSYFRRGKVGESKRGERGQRENHTSDTWQPWTTLPSVSSAAKR